MAIGESDDEEEVSILHLKDKIKFPSKERLSKLLLDFIDESKIISNEKEDLSRECVILKAKCKSLESRANKSDRIGKKKADHTYLTLEENLGKIKDELYRKDEQIKVLKKDLGKEYEDEAIGLVKDLTEASAQVKVAPKERTGDGTCSSIQGNLIGGTDRRGTETNHLKEPVHDPVPQQQNMGETSSRNQLVSLWIGKAPQGEGHRSSDSKKIQESPSKVSSSVIENLETRFVLVGPIRDVELPGIRRSGGKKNFEKDKAREGACGKESGIGKGVVPTICMVEYERVEESGMKSGGSGSGEAAEGLVHLSTQRDEHIPSTEETLADLLKKGRVTRSKVKQSEADLQGALEESKKKRKDKGKGNIVESSKAVEEEEMELVHQERGTTVEVPTPKPKKPKTSSKKPSSVPVTDETTLSKRTRSIVKTKQSKVSDDDDWSGEEEEENDSEKEHDKLVIFGRRKILKGRLLKDLWNQE
ncbi:uncharacterized protein [Nicotiana sylvestris]|uniref:uncharacterized protein n=1 Tax=Nicotiana sylvestris TaxID=4096 RepID=UPI00388C959C